MGIMAATAISIAGICHAHKSGAPGTCSCMRKAFMAFRFYFGLERMLCIMVVIMKPQFTQQQLETAIHEMEAAGVRVMVSQGSETTILGAEGKASLIDQEKM